MMEATALRGTAGSYGKTFALAFIVILMKALAPVKYQYLYND
jgi:hypothetical protein